MPLLLYDNFERRTREFTPLSTGEDKMEKGSRRTGKSAWEIAEEYTQGSARTWLR